MSHLALAFALVLAGCVTPFTPECSEELNRCVDRCPASIPSMQGEHDPNFVKPGDARAICEQQCADQGRACAKRAAERHADDQAKQGASQ